MRRLILMGIFSGLNCAFRNSSRRTQYFVFDNLLQVSIYFEIGLIVFVLSAELNIFQCIYMGLEAVDSSGEGKMWAVEWKSIAVPFGFPFQCPPDQSVAVKTRERFK